METPAPSPTAPPAAAETEQQQQQQQQQQEEEKVQCRGGGDWDIARLKCRRPSHVSLLLVDSLVVGLSPAAITVDVDFLEALLEYTRALTDADDAPPAPAPGVDSATGGTTGTGTPPGQRQPSGGYQGFMSRLHDRNVTTSHSSSITSTLAALAQQQRPDQPAGDVLGLGRGRGLLSVMHFTKIKLLPLTLELTVTKIPTEKAGFSLLKWISLELTRAPLQLQASQRSEWSVANGDAELVASGMVAPYRDQLMKQLLAAVRVTGIQVTALPSSASEVDRSARGSQHKREGAEFEFEALSHAGLVTKYSRAVENCNSQVGAQ
jgi:hypothetical protein